MVNVALAEIIPTTRTIYFIGFIKSLVDLARLLLNI